MNRDAKTQSRETMKEFLVSMESEEAEAEAKVENGTSAATTADGTDGVSDVAHWVMRNPEKGIALVQNRITVNALFKCTGILDFLPD